MGVFRLVFVLIILVFVTSCSDDYGQVAITTTTVTTTTVPTTTIPVVFTPTTTIPAATTVPVTTTTVTTTTQPEIPNQVKILYLGFDPKEINISQGETVTWICDDLEKKSHAILIYDKDEDGVSRPARSNGLLYKDKFSHTFETKGEFKFIDYSYKYEEEREEAIGLVRVS